MYKANDTTKQNTKPTNHQQILIKQITPSTAPHKTDKGDHNRLGLTNHPKLLFKIDHQQNDNPKYPKLCTKKEKKED